MDRTQAYLAKEKEATEALRTVLAGQERDISLVPKGTTHVMRGRSKRARLNLRKFDQVIRVDAGRMEAEVEGCTRFYDIAKETLKYGLIPKVVPEFRGITIGGTVSGLGVESSSFKYGVVQESLKQVTLLTGSGDIVECSPHERPDLWRALPNSFGSMGYVLKCTVGLVKAGKYVRIKVLKFRDPGEYFARMSAETALAGNDFIDGAIFSADDHVLILGTMTDSLPSGEEAMDLVTSIYYEELKKAESGKDLYLHTFDYLFRWDRDAFWGMESYPVLKIFLKNPFLRATILRPFLRTDRLLAIKKWRDRICGLTNKLLHPRNPPRSEELIQDFGIDIRKGAEFVRWYAGKFPIYPLWVCPLKKMVPAGTYPLFDFDCDIILDIGFYAKTDLAPDMTDDHYLKMGEQKLHEMGGMKALYSRNAYTEEEFWGIYDRESYFAAKHKYDPFSTFPDVYQKISRG